jgi:predicted RNA-binding protein YlqC (UPF0109 family)
MKKGNERKMLYIIKSLVESCDKIRIDREQKVKLLELKDDPDK